MGKAKQKSSEKKGTCYFLPNILLKIYGLKTNLAKEKFIWKWWVSHLKQTSSKHISRMFHLLKLAIQWHPKIKNKNLKKANQYIR